MKETCSQTLNPNIYKTSTFFLAIMLFISMHTNAQTLPVLSVTIDGGKQISDKYQQGTMMLTDEYGKLIELNAKFKTRGATAKNYSMKPSFNMKLRNTDFTGEQDSTLLGMRSSSSWILDAMAIDRICMRNRVCFDIWNEMSKLPYDTKFQSRNGTIGRFVEVCINNEYYGIYCLTDRINRKLLNLKKVKKETDGSVTPRGVIYKHGTNDIENQNIPGFYNGNSVYIANFNDAWELSEPEDYPSTEAWQPLVDVYNNQNRYEFIKSKFYIENLAEYQILIMALNIADNWGNKNRFFSAVNIQAKDDKSRLVITPWDMDVSLGGDEKGSYYGGNLNVEWSVNSTFTNSVLPFNTCLQQDEYMKLLRDKWIVARKGSLSVESVAKHLRKYKDLFINTGAWKRQWDYFQAQKYQPMIVEDLTYEIESIIKWYANRYAEMDAQFKITSGIENISTHNASKDFYDLQGRKVNKDNLQKGIYISNGRKYIINRHQARNLLTVLG